MSESNLRLVDDRQEHLRKRKKWIKSLSVFSSEEDNSDDRPDFKFDTSQLIAIRFPYPMASDDTDDEEDIKYFPINLNASASTNKKRSDISTSDEQTIQKHKRNKKTVEKTQTKSPFLHHEVKDSCLVANNINVSGSHKNTTHTSHSSFSCDSSDNNNEYQMKIPSCKIVDDVSTVLNSSSINHNTTRLPEGSNTTILPCLQHNNQDEEKVEIKENVGNSRFLDSSSEEDINQDKKSIKPKSKLNLKLSTKYKRLHVLSSNSSDSDDTAVCKSGRPIKHFHKVTNNKLTVGSSRTKRIIQFSSTSNEEDSDKDVISKDRNILNKENEELPQMKSRDIHPCVNLVNSFNETEFQQKHDKRRANDLKYINTYKHGTVSNISKPNHSAWIQIANLPIKQKNDRLNQKTTLKISELRKKFSTSNISSVEIHKKIHNKPLIKSNEVEPSSMGKINIRNKVSPTSCISSKATCNDSSNINCTQIHENSIVEKHDDSRQSLGKNGGENVLAYSDSAHNNGIDNHKSNYTQLNSGDENDTPAKAKVFLNLGLHENKDDPHVNDTKKVKISQIQNADDKNEETSLIRVATKTKPAYVQCTSMKRIECHESEAKDNTNIASSQCDVLGSILSQMEKNPYKIEKPNKKQSETRTNAIGWSQNQFFMGTNNNSKPVSNSQSIVQGGVQTSSCNTSLNINSNIISPHSSNGTFLNSQSTTNLNENISRISINNLKPQEQKTYHVENSSVPANNIKPQQEISVGCNVSSPVVMKFYCADALEYGGEFKQKLYNAQLSQKNVCEIKPSNKILKTKDVDEQCDKEKTGKEALMKDKIMSSKNNSLDLNESAGYSGTRSDKSYKSRSVEQSVGKSRTLTASKTQPVQKVENRIVTKNDLPQVNQNSEIEYKRGIRIKLGDTIFRLPGTINSSDLVNKPATANTSNMSFNQKHETSPSQGKSKNNNNEINSNTSISREEDDTSSGESESNSDSDELGKSATEKSSSSDSSSESTLISDVITDSIDAKCSNETFAVPKLTAATLGNATSPGIEDEKHNNRLKCSVTSENDVIVLSDSSDSEHNTRNEHSECIITKNIGIAEKDLALNTVTKKKYISDRPVGKIRVKSLRDLGVTVQNLIPDNALPTISPVSLPVVTNKQPKMQIKQPIPISTENTSVLESSSNKLAQSVISNVSKQIRSKDIVNMHIESCIESVIAQSIILSASKCRTTQSKENPKQTASLNYTLSTECTEVNKPQITQELPSKTKQNEVAEQSSVGTETLFFELCDKLFIDIVHLKIPKLVDDLHLSILHDRIKEERLKKLDQLISPETIASEKRRAEKDFTEMIKIRGQSFVPLFMTIVNKITKDNFKTLVTTLYCRIVHQLERIEPANADYRFKLKDIIKFMLQKHSSPDIDKVLAVFNAEECTFTTNFNFVEKLLFKYDIILEERQRNALEKQRLTNNNQSSSTITNLDNTRTMDKVADEVDSNTNVNSPKNNPTHSSVRMVPGSTPPGTGPIVLTVLKPTATKTNIVSLPVPNQPNPSTSNTDQGSTLTSSAPPPLNPLIGNLDSILFKKTSAVKNTPR